LALFVCRIVLLRFLSALYTVELDHFSFSKYHPMSSVKRQVNRPFCSIVRYCWLQNRNAVFLRKENTIRRKRKSFQPNRTHPGQMRHCKNLVISGSSDQTVLLHFHKHSLPNIIRFLPASVIEYSSLRNQSSDLNIICNLARTAPKVLP
jgi:hypothetical protein